MDPIHPILPQRPNLPPVAPPPRVGRIDRDRDREQARRERRPDTEDEPDGQRRREPENGGEELEVRPRIDLTA